MGIKEDALRWTVVTHLPIIEMSDPKEKAPQVATSRAVRFPLALLAAGPAGTLFLAIAYSTVAVRARIHIFKREMIR